MAVMLHVPTVASKSSWKAEQDSEGGGSDVEVGATKRPRTRKELDARVGSRAADGTRRQLEDEGRNRDRVC